MKSPTLLFFFLIFISTFFYNCSPVPITKVYIDNNDVSYWQNGTAIGEKVATDVVAEAVYSHTDKNFIYFDIAFENKGEERILINPQEFILVNKENKSVMTSVNPEMSILRLEMKDSKQTAKNKTLALAAGTVIVAGTIAAIAADGDSGSTQNNDDCDDFYTDTYIFTDLTPDHNPPMSYSYFNQEPLLSSNVRELPDSENVIFWEKFALRKSTIFPNQRIRGLVAFVKNEIMKKSQLVIPILSQELTFDFNHYKYKP